MRSRGGVCLLASVLIISVLAVAMLVAYAVLSKRKQCVPDGKASKHFALPLLSCGLGNQLFMISAAIAVAKASNRQVVIHSSCPPNLHMQELDKYVKTIFRSFKTVDRDVDTSDYSKIDMGDGVFIAWNPYAPPMTPGTSPHVVLSGYFQYFPALQHIENELVSTFRKNLGLTAASMQQVVGIHVRRGDYLGLYSITPLSYFTEAMRFTRARIPGPLSFVLFTNDPTWCRAQRLFSECVFNNEKDDVKCLASMASCKLGFICSNSTYSWWGAFLGAHHAGGIVCAPSEWVNSSWVNPRDGTLYPKTWNIIDVDVDVDAKS